MIALLPRISPGAFVNPWLLSCAIITRSASHSPGLAPHTTTFSDIACPTPSEAFRFPFLSAQLAFAVADFILSLSNNFASANKIVVATRSGCLTPRPKRCQIVHMLHLARHCTITAISGMSTPYDHVRIHRRKLMQMQIYHSKGVRATKPPCISILECCDFVLPESC